MASVGRARTARPVKGPENFGLDPNKTRQAVNGIANRNATRIFIRAPQGQAVSLFRLQSPPIKERPNFVIKWGPPASGKGSADVKAAIEALGQPMSSYIQIGIDDLVEATKYFKNESMNRAKEIFNTRRNVVNSTNKNSITAFLNKITEANAKKLGNVYSGIRNSPGSNGSKLSNKLNSVLKQAISLGKNITFESTGLGGWPNWLFTNSGLKASNYNVHIVFPLVPFVITWRRYRQRAAYQFLKGNGIRFASTKKQARQQYVASYTQFENLFREVKNNNLLTSVTVLPWQKKPIKYTAPRLNVANTGRLRSRNLLAVMKAVGNFKRSAEYVQVPN